MAGYVKGSKAYLEKLEMDIANDLQELSKNVSKNDKKRIDRIFKNLDIIHHEYSVKGVGKPSILKSYGDRPWGE